MTCAPWSTSTVARFGRLDVAVNNAGTEGQPGPITEQSAETYAATFDTNVLGVILSMKHEVRVMQAQGSGSIINVSSTYGHEGAPGASVYAGGSTPSRASPSRWRSRSPIGNPRERRRAWPNRHRHADPFYTARRRTRRLWWRRFRWVASASHELADAIVFLASDEASFITGHVLNVDGGKSAM